VDNLNKFVETTSLPFKHKMTFEAQNVGITEINEIFKSLMTLSKSMQRKSNVGYLKLKFFKSTIQIQKQFKPLLSNHL